MLIDEEFEGRTLTLKVKFLDFKQITRSIIVDHILRTKNELQTPPLPLPLMGGEWLRLRARHVLTF